MIFQTILKRTKSLADSNIQARPMSDVLYKHAPCKQKKVPDYPTVPWFNKSLSDEIRLNRRLERSLQSDQKNTVKYTNFYLQRWKVSNVLNSAERYFLHSRLHENPKNPKQIFRICNSLLGRKKDSPLPPGFTKQQLANNFNSFFTTKITNIRNQMDTPTASTSPLKMELVRTTSTLNTFWFLTSQDVSKVILSSPSKSCESYPIPTDLLKAILPVVLNLLTGLINRSLQTGTFPSNLKEALVKPLLKKTTLELIDQNYQPVSNLAFIGKMLE